MYKKFDDIMREDYSSNGFKINLNKFNILNERLKNDNLKFFDIIVNMSEGFITDNFSAKDSELAEVLINKYGWEPKKFTSKGKPSMKKDIISKLKYDIIPYILNFKLSKLLLSTMATWEKSMDDEGHITHECSRISKNGSLRKDGRCNHTNKFANIPSDKGNAYKQEVGAAIRDIFEVDEGYLILGADLSSIDLVSLAEYLYDFDGGKYASFINSGNAHWQNAKALGLVDHTEKYNNSNRMHKYIMVKAKIFIYAFLFGAGIDLISEILQLDRDETIAALNEFNTKITGLAVLKKAIEYKINKYGKLKVLDGTEIEITEVWKGLQLLTSNASSAISRLWVEKFYNNMVANGYQYNKDFYFLIFLHDEIQIAVRDSIKNSNDRQKIANVISSSCRESGKELGVRARVTCSLGSGMSWQESK